uniref:Secreted protein n=1 Tax=Haemonchus placei TaxID=6290 RepID=A0A0N4X7D3_HAEPC
LLYESALADTPIRGTVFRLGTSQSDVSPSASDDDTSSSIINDERWLSSSRLPFCGRIPVVLFLLVSLTLTSSPKVIPSEMESQESSMFTIRGK